MWVHYQALPKASMHTLHRMCLHHDFRLATTRAKPLVCEVACNDVQVALDCRFAAHLSLEVHERN
jgi:hypothetical protein